MSNRRAIFCLLALLVLSGIAHLMLAWRGLGTLDHRGLRVLVSDLIPAQVTISSASGETLVLAKAERWQLVAPYVGRVDETRVQKLIDTFASAAIIESLSEQELLTRGSSLDDLGLSEPALTVAFTDGQRTFRVDFGRLTPETNGVYACLGETREIAVLPRQVREIAAVDAASFRDRRILGERVRSVTSFDLRRPGNPVAHLTRVNEAWRINSQAASDLKVRTLLARLTELEALDFVWPVGASNEAQVISAPLLSGYGLDTESALVLSFQSADGLEESIALGNEAAKGAVYALVHGGSEIVTLDASVKALAQQEFADAHLFPFAASEVYSVTLARDNEVCRLLRDAKNDWLIDAPIRAAANPEVVQTWISCLLKLTTPDRATEGVLVTVNTNGASAFVSPAALTGLGRWDEVRSRQICKIDPAQVFRLVIASATDPSRACSIVSARARQGWDVENSARTGIASVPKVAQILAALNPLMAESVYALHASEDDLSRMGLLKPAYSISIDQDTENGRVRRNLRIGEKTSGGRFATMGLTDAIFVISQETVDRLRIDPIEE